MDQLDPEIRKALIAGGFTLLSALIGFTGVIVTLAANAWLGRRSDERSAARVREAEDERAARAAASLRTGLTVELQHLIDRVTALLEEAVSGQRDLWVPVIDAFAVLKANAENLGLLTPSEVQAIVGAHATYQSRMGNIARLGNRDFISHELIGLNVYCLLDGASAPARVVANLREIREAATQALDALSDERGAV